MIDHDGSVRRGRLRPRVRGDATLGHAQPPLDGLEVHFADVGVAPGFLSVSEGRVENAAFAIHLGPGNREIVVRGYADCFRS
jgi:hypothetical protein